MRSPELTVGSLGGLVKHRIWAPFLELLTQDLDWACSTRMSDSLPGAAEATAQRRSSCLAWMRSSVQSPALPGKGRGKQIPRHAAADD